jgi:hypothetical protein
VGIVSAKAHALWPLTHIPAAAGAALQAPCSVWLPAGCTWACPQPSAAGGMQRRSLQLAGRCSARL